MEQGPNLQVTATQMNTIVTPYEPNATPSPEKSIIVIFYTVFYTLA